MGINVLFIETGTTGTGGSFKSLTEMCNALSNELENVKVIAFNESPYFSEMPNNVEVIRLQNALYTKNHPLNTLCNIFYYKLSNLLPLLKPVFNFFIYNSNKSKIINLVKQQRISIIHCNNQPERDQYFINLGIKLKLTIVSHIRTLHSSSYLEFNYPNLTFIAVSNLVKNLWIKKLRSSSHFPISIAVVNNFINNSIFENHKNNKFSKLTLAYLGRLIPNKGIEKIISILPRLKRNFPELNFYFIGSGPLFNMIEEEINKNQMDQWVFLSGQLNNPYDHLSKCHFLLLFSEDEGFGKVYVEAMGVGTIPIGYQLTSASEIITDNFNGVLVNKDADLFYQVDNVIKKYYFDNNLYNYIKQNALISSRALYSEDDFKNKIMQIYKKSIL
jgi:glycosyltransferase involved in cell wall biosynthesis